MAAAIVHSPKREVCDCQSHGIVGLLPPASTPPVARGPRDFMRLGVGLPTSLPNVRGLWGAFWRFILRDQEPDITFSIDDFIAAQPRKLRA
jgi:hypothetical protein